MSRRRRRAVGRGRDESGCSDSARAPSGAISRVAGVFGVVHRVVADLIARAEDVAHRRLRGATSPGRSRRRWRGRAFGAARGGSPACIRWGRHRRSGRRPCGRAARWCRGRRLPPVQPTGRTGRRRKRRIAADGRARLQAQRRLAQSGAARRPPDVAVRVRARHRSGSRVDDELAGSGRLTRAAQVSAGRSPAAVDQLEPDPAVGFRGRRGRGAAGRRRARAAARGRGRRSPCPACAGSRSSRPSGTGLAVRTPAISLWPAWESRARRCPARAGAFLRPRAGLRRGTRARDRDAPSAKMHRILRDSVHRASLDGLRAGQAAY